MFVERMAVEIEGEGEPVVMIHGLGGTSNTFTPLLAAFGRHRTIRFDLPGSGRSHRVEGPLSVQLFVERALLVMQRADVERAHVVAHSMGTIVAAHLAAAEPGKVASLTLFGPLLAPPDPARTAIRARAAEARKGDMQPIADGLLRSSVSAETRAKRPAALAFVRELQTRPLKQRQRVQAFIAAGHGSRPTYFRYLKLVKAEKRSVTLKVTPKAIGILDTINNKAHHDSVLAAARAGRML